MSDYKWRQNMACVATYNILEGDSFLDQFEDSEISFKDAEKVKLNTLPYYPQTTNNPEILRIAGYEYARLFIKYLVKIYTVSRQNIKTSSAEILTAIAETLMDGEKTILELAEVVDDNIRFPDEQ